MPAPAAVLGSVVRQVAALAQGGKVAAPVVGGIVVEVGAGQHHAGEPRSRLRAPLPSPPPSIAPAAERRIPPLPVRVAPDMLEMRSATMLAAAFSSFEANGG